MFPHALPILMPLLRLLPLRTNILSSTPATSNNRPYSPYTNTVPSPTFNTINTPPPLHTNAIFPRLLPPTTNILLSTPITSLYQHSSLTHFQYYKYSPTPPSLAIFPHPSQSTNILSPSQSPNIPSPLPVNQSSPTPHSGPAFHTAARRSR
jgi:hypothetical protein